MLDRWISWEQRESAAAEFDIIDVVELGAPSLEVKQHLRDIHLDALAGLSTFEKIARELGWGRMDDWLKNRVPSTLGLKRGVFGEVLAGAMLTQFHGYAIPVEKLRFRFSANQSPPFTDLVAFKVGVDELEEICFIESKLRTGSDTLAAKQAHDQLYADARVALPQILQFVAWRLDEQRSPLFGILMDYLRDRRSISDKDSFRVCLTWEDETWTESALSNMEGEVQLEHLTVHVTRIKDLVKLVDEVYASIGEPPSHEK